MYLTSQPAPQPGRKRNYSCKGTAAPKEIGQGPPPKVTPTSCSVPSWGSPQTLGGQAKAPSWVPDPHGHVRLPQPTFLLGPGARVPESNGLGTRCFRLGTGLRSADTAPVCFQEACEQVCVWAEGLCVAQGPPPLTPPCTPTTAGSCSWIRGPGSI